MIFMPQISDVIANKNARYKHDELESPVYDCDKETNILLVW